MAVYIFSLLVGFVPNGVDNAQGYRSRVYKEAGIDAKFVFFNMPGMRYIKRYVNAGVDIESMYCIQQSFTDNHSLRPTLNADELALNMIKELKCDEAIYCDNEIKLIRDGSRIVSIYFDEVYTEKARSINYYNNENLIRTDFLSDGVLCSDFFVPREKDGHRFASKIRTEYYNRNGSVKLSQIFENNKSFYVLENGERFSEVELIERYIIDLNLTENDVVIIDRPGEMNFTQPLFMHGRNARIVAIIHSEHYFEVGQDPHNTGINWEYVYWFKNAKYISCFVVGTEEQKIALENYLKIINGYIPEIVVIPAGSLSEIQKPENNRKPYSIISVARLDKRKKIDVVVNSVIKAHKINPDISIDLYGRGDADYMEYLKVLVEKADATGYVHFKGQAKVIDLYKDYQVYLSASTWETFGLSLMEAVGSGMAIIGFDVKYGNRLFVKPGKNGYLIPFEYADSDNDDKWSDLLCDKILEIFEDSGRLEAFHEKSYEIAKNYMYDVVKDKWLSIL